MNQENFEIVKKVENFKKKDFGAKKHHKKQGKFQLLLLNFRYKL